MSWSSLFYFQSSKLLDTAQIYRKTSNKGRVPNKGQISIKCCGFLSNVQINARSQITARSPRNAGPKQMSGTIGRDHLSINFLDWWVPVVICSITHFRKRVLGCNYLGTQTRFQKRHFNDTCIPKLTNIFHNTIHSSYNVFKLCLRYQICIHPSTKWHLYFSAECRKKDYTKCDFYRFCQYLVQEPVSITRI